MKRQFFTTAAFLFAALITVPTFAQKFSDLDKSPMDAASFPANYRDSNKLIKVTYSRPQLKGREVGNLAKNGEVWRTGANEACELTLYVPMNVGDKLVPAGTYSFYTIPGETEWTAIISKDLNTWGSYFYNQKNDVVRLTVPVTKGEKKLEAFGMVFTEAPKGAHLNLGWGTVRVAVPFETATM
ncbi:MAG: DUF2911 domain-containing protein [Marinirhabdus sp.]